MDKTKKLIKSIKEKIVLLDNEEQEIGRLLKEGKLRGEKRIRQKMCIRCFYMTYLFAYLNVLNGLGVEKSFVKEIWNKRKGQYVNSYEDSFKLSKIKDYPKVKDIKNIRKLN